MFRQARLDLLALIWLAARLRLTRILLLVLGSSAFATPFLAEDSPVQRELPPEIRRHWQVASRGTVLYRFTTILKMTETKHETIVLVRDEGHGDFVIRDRWSFEDQTVVYRISTLDDRAFLQQSYKMPLSAKGRKRTMDEVRATTILTEGETTAIIRIETNGGQWERSEDELKDDVALRRLRHDLRSTMNFPLLEMLERMRGTFFATEDGQQLYGTVARLVLYDAGSATTAADVQISEAQPTCDFDESFGFPCSETQLSKIEKATKEGKRPVWY
jgi:hypothetical protein